MDAPIHLLANLLRWMDMALEAGATKRETGRYWTDDHRAIYIGHARIVQAHAASIRELLARSGLDEALQQRVQTLIDAVERSIADATDGAAIRTLHESGFEINDDLPSFRPAFTHSHNEHHGPLISLAAELESSAKAASPPDSATA